MSGPEDLKTVARRVRWRDLLPMSRREGIAECLLPLPWLAAAFIFAQFALWPVALTCEFMFFLVALRLNHEAIHHNIGFGKLGHRLVMHGLSAVMLGSNHSVAFNHLRHHAHINTARDIEGKCGRMNLAEVLAYGPMFPLECHAETWKRGDAAWRGRLAIDLALNLILPGLALATLWPPLVFHAGIMLVAQCFTALFAVWITHHGCEDHDLVARTQRSRWINFASYNMFFHLEHHLFPAVPVRRLPELARRMDAAAPWIGGHAGRVVGHGPVQDGAPAIAPEAPLA
jgi:fatty acid desaturase